MTMNEQLMKLKENWLIIVLVAIVLLAMSGGPNMLSSVKEMASSSYNEIGYGGSAQRDMAYGKSGYYPPVPQNDGFAPDVKDRKIAKTASMSTEVERGRFNEAESKMRSIVAGSDSFLLSQNVNNYGTGMGRYKQGVYSIKIESGKYDSVVSQLKDIGEVNSFNENSEDITGQFTSIEDELRFEKDKLDRYQKIYDSSATSEDKMNLIDRIAGEERMIKYLEDSLKDAGLRVSYSTLGFSMNEKQSGYANIGLVKLSDLARNFVSSASALFSFAFVLLPWAMALFIIRLLWNIFRKNKDVKGRK